VFHKLISGVLMSEQKSGRRFTGRVAFLYQLDAIKKEVESGASLTSIYEARKSSLGFSSQWFHTLVNRQMGLSRDRHPTSPARPGASTAPMPPASSSLRFVSPTLAEGVQSVPVPPKAALAPDAPSEGKSGVIHKISPRPSGFQHYNGPATDLKDHLI
jgi:hypothetical protein